MAFRNYIKKYLNMKYVAVDGGLGNQMFQYAFMLALKAKGNDTRLFFPHKKWEHKSGFELSRVFDVNIEKSAWQFLYNWIPYPFRKLFLVTHKTFHDVNFHFLPEALSSKKYYYYYGTWQSELYFKDIQSIIRDAFSFNYNLLSDKTLDILKIITNSPVPTVSIHVRRGDYLSISFKDGLGCCCTLDYYKHAISYVLENIHKNVLFVFFSDDISWVKDNIKVPNALYVNHNCGLDSWQDMFLMSQCSFNIIANSSFSWWAAWLNSNIDKIVIAPKRWWASLEDDDVVPKSWIRM